MLSTVKVWRGLAFGAFCSFLVKIRPSSTEKQQHLLFIQTRTMTHKTLERRLDGSTKLTTLTQETDVHIPFPVENEFFLTMSTIVFRHSHVLWKATDKQCCPACRGGAGSETLASALEGNDKQPILSFSSGNLLTSIPCMWNTVGVWGGPLCWRVYSFCSFCWNQQVQTVSYNQLAQSWTSGLHWTGMRNARSEPMPLPGLTESFYTLSSLLSQFYPLFHSILIGHSSLEHVCTLEALSVIPYHPQLCLSLTAPPLLLFFPTAPLSLFLPICLLSVIFVLLYLL